VHSAGYYLDPCQWGGGQTVIAGAAATPVTITLALGVPVRVRVLDPNAVLAAAGAVGPRVVVSAFSTGSQSPWAVPPVLSMPGETQYFRVLPNDPGIKLSVSASGMTLTDQTGAPLAPGGTIAIPPAHGSIPAVSAVLPGPNASSQERVLVLTVRPSN
jgi:hypothetical protein